MWQPIEDLPTDWQTLASTELPPLVKVWSEQTDRLRQSREFQVFNEKLRREIAIETGIIERLYTLDRGITRLLIEQGLNESIIQHGTTNRPPRQVIALIADQEAAIESLFDFVGGQRSLSTAYVKELHQLLTHNQTHTDALDPLTGAIVQVPLLQGQWKQQPNNPQRPDNSVHEYCPPLQVGSEMDNLLAWHQQHREQGVPPEIEAAWLHHRFTQIHPFQDGNGRMARCLASLVFIQAQWFPLVLTRDDRADYIAALEAADQGNLTYLVNLWTKSQKQQFLKVLTLSEQVMAETRRARTIIAAATERLRSNQSTLLQTKRAQAEHFASRLFETAKSRLEDIAEELRLSVANVVSNAQVFTVAASAGDERTYYHRYQVVETARRLGYFADLRSYHTWLQLVINVETSTTILLSFHAFGHEYRGLLVCTACAYHRDNTEAGENSISEIQPLTDTPFQFSYADNEENLVVRFQQCLEAILIAGLEYWNQSL